MRAWRVEIFSNDPFVYPVGAKMPEYQLPSTLILQENMFNVGDSIAMEFETVVYNDKTKGEVYDRATLTLFNINRYWHNMNSQQALSGAKVFIYAGTKITPLIQRQGLVGNIANTLYAHTDNEILSKPVYIGYIANCYPDMDGATNSLLMNLTAARIVKEDKLVVNQLNLIKGANWRLEVKRFIDELLLQKKMVMNVVVGIPTVKSKGICETNYNTKDVVKIFDDGEGDGLSVSSFVSENFNEVIYKDGNTIYIGERPPSLEIFNINDENLLGQPQMIDAGTVVINVPLNNNFYIGATVNLGIESFVSYMQNFVADGDSTNSILTLTRGNEHSGKMYSGTFKVKSIKHQAQSRNTGVESWCTTLELNKVL